MFGKNNEEKKINITVLLILVIFVLIVSTLLLLTSLPQRIFIEKIHSTPNFEIYSQIPEGVDLEQGGEKYVEGLEEGFIYTSRIPEKRISSNNVLDLEDSNGQKIFLYQKCEFQGIDDCSMPIVHIVKNGVDKELYNSRKTRYRLVWSKNGLLFGLLQNDSDGFDVYKLYDSSEEF